ncbi:MAG: anti-sigma factor family protein [Candidatus Korobacteraceae bacterium]
MKRMKTNCPGMDAELAGLLLDPSPASAKVQAHVAECKRCQDELADLKTTVQALDAWKAPAPSPYFLTRLGARMREEREAVPAGWLAGAIARLRATVKYGSGLHVRPLAAVALTVVLLVGGGTYLGVTDWMQPAQQTGQNAAVVSDLQTLDSNAQVLDQMEALTGNQNGD